MVIWRPNPVIELEDDLSLARTGGGSDWLRYIGTSKGHSNDKVKDGCHNNNNLCIYHLVQDVKH